jgi:hypothetical protein
MLLDAVVCLVPLLKSSYLACLQSVLLPRLLFCLVKLWLLFKPSCNPVAAEVVVGGVVLVLR